MATTAEKLMTRDTLTQEIETLKKIKDSMEKEINEKRTLFNQDIESRNMDLRKRENAIREEEAKVKEDKADFTKIMEAFQNEKDSVSDALKASEASKAMYESLTDKAGRFILMVKREAEKL